MKQAPADAADSLTASTDLSRRKFLTRATMAVGAIGAGFASVPFIASWLPSERARALGGPDELDPTKIEPGQDGRRYLAQEAHFRCASHRGDACIAG